MKAKKGFTLIELMVVILIVGILAAVSVPLMRGRIDSAKWSEANAAAGSIRSAVRAYMAEKGPNHDFSDVEGSLSTTAIHSRLGFASNDLDGSYFNQADYTIDSVDAANGTCVITVDGSGSANTESPDGTGTLSADGSWEVQ